MSWERPARPTMGEFVIKRVSDDWQAWEIYHGDDYIMPVDRDQARRAMLGKYDPAELVRGRLVLVKGENGNE